MEHNDDVTIIHCKCFAEFRALLIYFKLQDWKWSDGREPEENLSSWIISREHTGVEYKDKFMLTNVLILESFLKESSTPIPPSVLEALERAPLPEPLLEAIKKRIGLNKKEGPKLITFEDFAKEHELDMPEIEPEIVISRIQGVPSAIRTDPGVNEIEAESNPCAVVVKEGIICSKQLIDVEMWTRVNEAFNTVKEFYSKKSN